MKGLVGEEIRPGLKGKNMERLVSRHRGDSTRAEEIVANLLRNDRS
jgi:hypothetical protein